MGIAHVKEHLRDLPGAESMSMDMQAGQCVYSINGFTVTLPASTSDADAAAAIRATLTDSAARAAAPQPASIPPMPDAPSAALIPSVSPAPAAAPAGVASPASHALTIKDALAQHSAKLDAILQASLATLQAALDDQVNTVTGGVDAVTTKVKSHTDDFKAILGQFTNQF